MDEHTIDDDAWLTKDQIVIRLTVAEALVLDAMFARSSESHERDALTIHDKAEWHALWTIAGGLERGLVEIFSRDYDKYLERALREVRGEEDGE